MLVTVSCDRLFRDRPLSGKTAIVIGSLGSTADGGHIPCGIITDGQLVSFRQRTNWCIGRAVVSENKSITALGIFRLKDLAVDHDLCRLDIKCDKTAGCKAETVAELISSAANAPERKYVMRFMGIPPIHIDNHSIESELHKHKGAGTYTANSV